MDKRGVALPVVVVDVLTGYHQYSLVYIGNYSGQVLLAIYPQVVTSSNSGGPMTYFQFCQVDQEQEITSQICP